MLSQEERIKVSISHVLVDAFVEPSTSSKDPHLLQHHFLHLPLVQPSEEEHVGLDPKVHALLRVGYYVVVISHLLLYC